MLSMKSGIKKLFSVCGGRRIKRDNRLSFSYMVRYILSHLKEKKYRTIIAASSLSVGLSAIGIAVMVTVMVGNTVKDSMRSLMDGGHVMIARRDDASSALNETYACPYSTVEDIAMRYPGKIQGVGSYYLSDFDNLFPDADHLLLLSGTYTASFAEFNAKSINECGHVSDVRRDRILPCAPDRLEEDEAVLQLREKDIRKIAQALELSRFDAEGLSEYLEREELAFTFVFQNDSWGYRNEVFLRCPAFVVGEEPGLLHTSLRWNERMLEGAMRLKSSDDLIASDPSPWTLKKVYYLKAESSDALSVLDTLLQDETLDGICFDFVKPHEKSPKGPSPKDGWIYATLQRQMRITFSQWNAIRQEAFRSYLFSVPGSYTVFQALMMHGFTNATFLSSEERKILRVNDAYSVYEKNINTVSLRMEESGIVSGGVAGIAEPDNLKFLPQADILSLQGRYAEAPDEILLSARAAQLLFPGTDYRRILNRTVFFSTVRSVAYDSGSYHHRFAENELKIVGIATEEEARCAVYSLPTWPIYYYAGYLGFSLTDLAIRGVYASADCDIVEEERLELWRRQHPEYSFENPALQFTSGVDQVLSYVRWGLLGFSMIATVSSMLMTGLVLYLFIVENRKEIGLLKALGIRRSSIALLFVCFALFLGWIAFSESVVTLTGTGLMLSRMLSGSIPLAEYAQAVGLMLAFMAVASGGIGLIASLRALKYDPLMVLKEK